MEIVYLDPRTGYRWYPFDVEFDSPEGRFSVIIYGINEEHARLQLDSLKENGRITGQIIGFQNV